MKKEGRKKGEEGRKVKDDEEGRMEGREGEEGRRWWKMKKEGWKEGR